MEVIVYLSQSDCLFSINCVQLLADSISFYTMDIQLCCFCNNVILFICLFIYLFLLHTLSYFDGAYLLLGAT